MISPALRHTFVALHLTLGLVLLVTSMQTAIETVRAGSQSGLALAVFATIEAIAAFLFLLPRTTRTGGIALISVLLFAFVLHALRADWELPLLVYAAGVMFVVVPGPAYGRGHALHKWSYR